MSRLEIYTITSHVMLSTPGHPFYAFTMGRIVIGAPPPPSSSQLLLTQVILTFDYTYKVFYY